MDVFGIFHFHNQPLAPGLTPESLIDATSLLPSWYHAPDATSNATGILNHQLKVLELTRCAEDLAIYVEVFKNDLRNHQPMKQLFDAFIDATRM